MNKENCALKLVDEIILYYDGRSKKHQNNGGSSRIRKAGWDHIHTEHYNRKTTN